MNKFHGPNDLGYTAVARKVKVILHEIHKNQPIDRANTWIRNEYYTADRLNII
jgi:hypothetical protein